VSTINLDLPDSLHAQVRAQAAKDNVSVDRFIALALAEKLSALMTEEYLRERARRGDAETFRRALDKVADVEPDERDRIRA
jgi:hypothetical protein